MLISMEGKFQGKRIASVKSKGGNEFAVLKKVQDSQCLCEELVRRKTVEEKFGEARSSEMVQAVIKTLDLISLYF